MGTGAALVAVCLVTPLLAAGLSVFIRRARVLHGLNLATMTALGIAEMAVVQRVLAQGPFTALWGLVYLDALSACAGSRPFSRSRRRPCWSRAWRWSACRPSRCS